MCPFYNTCQMHNFNTDIDTEELAHLEMVASIVYQLTKNLSMEEIENSGFKAYYVDHTLGIWPQAASGQPFSAAQFQSCGDPIRFLRQREIVHFQRFGEALRLVQDRLDSKNFYMCNPAFDTNCPCGCK